ncbi:MAG TPA: hypothetical protein VIH90_04600 [Candidatus Saccharimonadales bacterium]
MAFYSKEGELVTQGDQELVTVSGSIDMIKEVAVLLYPDAEEAEDFRKACVRLSGKVSMMFFITPSDPMDAPPSPLTVREASIADQAPESIVKTIEEGLPEYGRTEHPFDPDESKFIEGALQFASQCTPHDIDNTGVVVQAALMLQQLGVELS